MDRRSPGYLGLDFLAKSRLNLASEPQKVTTAELPAAISA
ncbi:hypothetical protein GCM10009790_35980 [Georgenia ruanii]